MKPYKLIQDALKVCEDLKYNLQYSKNRARDTKRINKVLRALKGFDSMLVSKYKTDAIEVLMYASIQEILTKRMVQVGKPIPIDEIKQYFEECLSYDKEYKIQQVISTLKEHEFSNLSKRYNYQAKDKKLFVDLQNRRTEKEWRLLLSQLINVYKEDIRWISQK